MSGSASLILRWRLRVLAGAVLASLLALAVRPARADAGRDAYEADCSACHVLTDASTASGPALKGIVWRNVAARRDFAYSTALKNVLGVWTPERLDAYLKDTQVFAPGTDMFFTVGDPARRRAIVAFLEKQK